MPPDLFYILCRACVRVLAFLFLSFRVSGREHLPKKGAFILASNHVSHFDPPILTAATPRAVDYLTSAEFFHDRFVSWFFRSLNAFPFDRTRRDMGSIKVCLERLEQGRAVGIFVEGGIRHGALSVLNGGPIKDGSLTLARNAGVPIVPVVLIGPDQLYQWRSLFRRPRIFIRFGPPFIPAPGADPRDLSVSFKEAMATLLADLERETPLRPGERAVSAQERWKNR